MNLRRSTDTLEAPQRKALIVCGPTAAGKSALADAFARSFSEALGAWSTTIVVDSVQVYEEIPLITNQARTRPAEMVGIVSVDEEWSVVRHKERAERMIASLDTGVPFVLDAGTGMYLNTLVLDVPIAPKAPRSVRVEAQRLAADAENPRREARKRELGLLGAPERGSIWEGNLRYDATFVYLRPSRDELDRNIRTRSYKISCEGAEEARRLENLKNCGTTPNPSVRGAIGVREMLLHASGAISRVQAEEAIGSRTRKLARRQIRWFDKLARSLSDRSSVLVADSVDEEGVKHLIHDMIEA
jgi:tRNA dimethylallyltransferase